jgi:hypothetical protein
MHGSKHQRFKCSHTGVSVINSEVAEWLPDHGAVGVGACHRQEYESKTAERVYVDTSATTVHGVQAYIWTPPGLQGKK